MSADYLGATLVVPKDPATINLDKGIEALNNAELDDYPLINSIHDTLETIYDEEIDKNAEIITDVSLLTDDFKLKILKTYFTDVIKEIVDLAQNGADDIHWETIENSDYKTIFTGGFSYGDAPTESADLIWKASELPPSVFQALNLR